MAARTPGGRLGTFAGVFTPSVLTILGIILFLRLGYVVGAGGLGRALLIIGLANFISLVTSTSVAAIATNIRVKGGGDYYLISRTLGVEYGGALGIVLFVAQSVSVAFYAIGFSEALCAALGAEAAWMPRAIALSAVSALFVLAWLGADVATRFQYFVMAILFASIAVFFVGGLGRASGATLRANWYASADVPFWTLFALFFPAVTGFTQGVSMSGDLKDPGRSLPRGTFLAVGVSIVVYFGVAVVFAAALPGTELAGRYDVMRDVSAWAPLVDAGVIAATLSSALASFLGAPRILQSLAKDDVFPWFKPFAKGHGRAGNPRRGTLLTLGIAVATVAAGDLDFIAPVVSMFFLISYGLLNYATFFEAKARSPSFRPTFRWFDARLAFLGSLACLGAMLAINAVAGAVAVATLMAIHQYVSRTVEVTRWSDSTRSYRLHRLRQSLLGIDEDPPHARDWRPVILVFSDDPARRTKILRFSSWLEGNSGFTSAVKVIEEARAKPEEMKRELEKLKKEIGDCDCPVFARVVKVPDPDSGLPVLLESFGIGPLRANVVLLNWFDEEPGKKALETYGRHIALAVRASCNVVAYASSTSDLKQFEKLPPGERRIDLWYRENRTGHLMLLFAYLMTRTEDWEEATIRILAAPQRGETEEACRERLEKMLEDVRIAAELELVPKADDAAVRDMSKDAAVVFLPLRISRGVPVSPLTKELDALVRDLPQTALVLAAEDIDLDAEPEQKPA